MLEKMAPSEIVPGVYAIKGRFAGEFGFISSYLVVEGEEALVIDPGTAGDPGEEIVKGMVSLGLNPKKALIGILCTHGHPDHAGGAARLRRSTGAQIMIHSGDVDLLQDPRFFIKHRLRLDAAERLAMKMDRSPLRVNYTGTKPDRILRQSDEVKIGQVVLRVMHTGGHSAGHCVFLDAGRKILFSGDELNNLPDDSRKFYVDLSGSLTAKLAAIDEIAAYDIEYLLPAHDIPHIGHDARLQIQDVRDGVTHFLDTVLEHVSLRGEIDIEQLAFDVRQSRAVPVPEEVACLLPTTLEVALHDLEKAGLVKVDTHGVWKRV